MKYIEDEAFSGCENLTFIEMHGKDISFGEDVFPDKVLLNCEDIPFSLVPADLELKKTSNWLSGKITADDENAQAYSDYCKKTYKELFASLLADNQPEAIAKLLEIVKPDLDATNELLEQKKSGDT